MDFNLKLSSVSPSSLYVSKFMSPKSSLKQLTLHSSPVFGRCISEIKISSDKSSPLPTPVALNCYKPKTPTCVSKSLKLLKKQEKTSQGKVATPKAKPLKLKKKKTEKRKTETKKNSEPKLAPITEKTKKTLEKQKSLKEISKTTRKINSKSSKKNKEKYPQVLNQPSKPQLVINSPQLQSNKKKPKVLSKPLKKTQKKPQKSLPSSHNQPSPLLQKITKIQACIRGWLTRRTLATQKYSIDFSSHLTILHSSSQSHISEDLEVQKVLKNQRKPSFYNIIPSLTPSIALTDRSHHENSLDHSKNLLFSEIELKKKQSEKLRELQQHDMQEMRSIAERFSNKDEIVEVFSGAIQRRYDNLRNFFEKSILQLKQLRFEECSQDLERIFRFGNEGLKTEESREEIEKILLEIEKIDSENSVLCDPQPLPPLTPNCEQFNLRENSEERLKNHTEVSLYEENPESLRKLFKTEMSYGSAIVNEDEPLVCCLKVKRFESFGESTRDGSSGVQGCDVTDDSSTLQKEAKSVFSLKKTVWPVTRHRAVEQSKSALSQNNTNLLKESEENAVAERVVSLLELIIYHDFIENPMEILQDSSFLVKITEQFLEGNISELVIEADKALRTLVKSDSISLLHNVDNEFTKILKNPRKFTKRLLKTFDPITSLHLIRSNEKEAFFGLSLFGETEKKTDSFDLIYQNAVFCACSEAILDSISSQQSAIFDFVLPKIKNIKLSDFFVSIRKILFHWNEVQAGNMPSEETLKPDGDIDEDKLQSLRIQSLAKLLYQDLTETTQHWTNYYFEEQQSLLNLEKSIFSDLPFETLPIPFL